MSFVTRLVRATAALFPYTFSPGPGGGERPVRARRKSQQKHFHPPLISRFVEAESDDKGGAVIVFGRVKFRGVFIGWVLFLPLHSI